MRYINLRFTYLLTYCLDSIDRQRRDRSTVGVAVPEAAAAALAAGQRGGSILCEVGDEAGGRRTTCCVNNIITSAREHAEKRAAETPSVGRLSSAAGAGIFYHKPPSAVCKNCVARTKAQTE